MKQDEKDTQRFIETMIKDQKLKIKECKQQLSDAETSKKKTLEFLDRKRKQDEITYLHPISQKVEDSKKQLSKSKIEYTQMLIKQLEAFAKKESSLTASQLLKEYIYYKSLDSECLDIVDKKAQCLFDHFLQTCDIISASAFLKCRCGSKFSHKFDEQRERYLEHIDKHPIPIKSPQADCITGYGEYKDDIIKLFKVCGQIDFKLKPQDYEGVYYSEQTKKLMAQASIGEFGKLCHHVYYDMPYGFGVCDSDRKMLIVAHSKGYEMAKEATKALDEKSL